MSVIEFELAFPLAALSPNSRKYFHIKAEATRIYRMDCKVLALQAKRSFEEQGVYFPLKEPVLATYTFILPDKKTRDYVNLYGAFKAGEDGLRDAGIIYRDDVWHLHPTLKVEYKKGRKGVRVRLESDVSPQWLEE